MDRIIAWVSNVTYKCNYWAYIILILKVFKIFSMKVLSSKSEYFVIFLILLKLAGITSISDFGNQRSRYLADRLEQNEIRNI